MRSSFSEPGDYGNLLGKRDLTANERERLGNRRGFIRSAELGRNKASYGRNIVYFASNVRSLACTMVDHNYEIEVEDDENEEKKEKGFGLLLLPVEVTLPRVLAVAPSSSNFLWYQTQKSVSH